MQNETKTMLLLHKLQGFHISIGIENYRECGSVMAFFLAEKQTTTKYNQAVGFSSVLAVCVWLDSGLFIAERLWSRNIL